MRLWPIPANAILVAAAVTLCVAGASANITTSPPETSKSNADGSPRTPDEMTIAEQATQKEYNDNLAVWDQMIADCKKKSPSFKVLMEGVPPSASNTNGTPGIENDPSFKVDVQLVSSGAFTDQADTRGGMGKITVNINNLTRLPNPEIVNQPPARGLKPVNMPKEPPGTAWGMTRCELMAHFLREAKGMSINKVKSLSSKTGSTVPHDDGIVAQDAVRKDFNQITEHGSSSRCEYSILPGTTGDKYETQPLKITYKGKDGKPHTTQPSNQVQIHYGGGYIEVLWFDGDDKLQLAFFNGKTQISRDKLNLPADDPNHPENNYVLAPRPDAAASDDPVMLVADCPPPTSQASTDAPVGGLLGSILGHVSIGVGVGVGGGRDHRSEDRSKGSDRPSTTTSPPSDRNPVSTPSSQN